MNIDALVDGYTFFAFATVGLRPLFRAAKSINPAGTASATSLHYGKANRGVPLALKRYASTSAEHSRMTSGSVRASKVL